MVERQNKSSWHSAVNTFINTAQLRLQGFVGNYMHGDTGNYFFCLAPYYLLYLSSRPSVEICNEAIENNFNGFVFLIIQMSSQNVGHEILRKLRKTDNNELKSSMAQSLQKRHLYHCLPG